ncbi:MAG: hypothetical protein ACJAS1_000569 [Oleiphilaceae bacterium]
MAADAETEDYNEDDDLFVHYESLPEDVMNVVESFGKDDSGDDDYARCEKLIQDLKPLGYVCDYGLDGEPFALRKMIH